MLEKLTSQLKKYFPWELFSNKNITQHPLLDDAEILDLQMHVKNKKITTYHKHDISHRQTGDKRSVYRGYGMDYEESRRFQTGDDPRYMNWQLSARTGQHYIKVFQEERQAGVFIVIDRRLSMRFGTQQRLKVTQAVRAAAIAAFTAQQNNLSVAGVIIDQELQWFKQTQNKQAIFDFIKKSSRPVSPVFDSASTNELNFDKVLQILKEVLTHSEGSYIYLISDFHDVYEESQPILLQLAKTHHIQAIHIADIAEIKLPYTGDIKLKSDKSNNSVSINTHSKIERERYESAFDDYLTLKKNIFQSLAIPYKEILTSNKNIEQNVVL